MVMKRELGALRCSTQTTKHERREACRQNVDNRAFTELKRVYGEERVCVVA
jgi:acetyl-CoA carboxylase carboxyltransferase component